MTKTPTKRRPPRRKYDAAVATMRPGVISTVLTIMRRPAGATIPEIVGRLKRKFPERSVDSMTNTARINASIHARRKRREDGRVRYFR